MNTPFKVISCFFCGAKNPKSQELCDFCGKPLDISSFFVKKTIQTYILDTYKARGYYGLTFRCLQRTKPFAIKIISKAAYVKQNKDFNYEVDIYSKIPEHSSIAGFIFFGEDSIVINGEVVEFYYIISSWVNGVNLKDWFLGDDLSPISIYYFARDILTGLIAFDEAGLIHNDLHENNILVSELSESQRLDYKRDIGVKFTIVDIGSASEKPDERKKALTDLNDLGRHISDLTLRLKIKLSSFSKSDQYFVHLLADLCARLCDEDVQRGFANPKEVLDELEKKYLFSRSDQPENEQQTLDSPFGLINALQIRSPYLVTNLYSNKLPYFKQIMSIDNHILLITGPRGCGKTLALKLMSYDTILYNLSTDQRGFETVKYLGIFISARSELGSFSLATRRPDWINNERMVCFYFNVSFTIHLIKLLYKLIDIHVESLDNINAFLKKIKADFDLFTSDLLMIESDLHGLIKKLMDGHQLPITETNSTAYYIESTVSALTSQLSSLRNKRIVLLLDDLSMPKVPKEFIQHLLPFLFNPQSSYLVRITAHSSGIPLYDAVNDRITENRDYIEVNLGREYLKISDKYAICRDAFDDIMKKRYKLAKRDGYIGLEKMLGTPTDFKNIGKAIKNFSKDKKLSRMRYHGSYAFIALCSGDISYSVDLLRLMSEATGYAKTFSIKIQHETIRGYSRNQLYALKDYNTIAVKSLFEVGQAFGEYSRKLLEVKNSSYLRIEVELKGPIDQTIASAFQELFSSGLFIDGGFSNTGPGTMTKKLILRKIYTPAFPTATNNENTVNMDKKQFISFIHSPRAYLDNYYKSELNKKSSSVQTSTQFRLA